MRPATGAVSSSAAVAPVVARPETARPDDRVRATVRWRWGCSSAEPLVHRAWGVAEGSSGPAEGQFCPTPRQIRTPKSSATPLSPVEYPWPMARIFQAPLCRYSSANTIAVMLSRPEFSSMS